MARWRICAVRFCEMGLTKHPTLCTYHAHKVAEEKTYRRLEAEYEMVREMVTEARKANSESDLICAQELAHNAMCALTKHLIDYPSTAVAK